MQAKMFSLEYKLRRGRPADALLARKIFLAAVREHGLAPTTEGSADVACLGRVDPKRDDFVAVCRGKVVGFVTLIQRDDRTGEVSKLFVGRSHRDRGVGTMLINRAVETARLHGYEALYLHTNEEFAGARKYYERHGWENRASERPAEMTHRLKLCDATAAPPSVTMEPSRFLRVILSLLGRALRIKKRLAARV